MKKVVFLVCGLAFFTQRVSADEFWVNPDPRTSGRFVLLDKEAVQNFWVNRFPHGSALDRDFHKRKRAYGRLKAGIAAGSFHNEACIAALEWNLWMYQKYNDPENAAKTRAKLEEFYAAVKENEQSAQAATVAEEMPSRFNATDPNTGGYYGWVVYDGNTAILSAADGSSRRSGKVVQDESGKYFFETSGRKYYPLRAK